MKIGNELFGLKHFFRNNVSNALKSHPDSK